MQFWNHHQIITTYIHAKATGIQRLVLFEACFVPVTAFHWHQTSTSRRKVCVTYLLALALESGNAVRIGGVPASGKKMDRKKIGCS